MEEEFPDLRKKAGYWMYCFGVIMLISFSFLGYRLVDLQVLRHGELSNTARDNTVRTIVREPRRGDILDVRGNLMATSLFVKTICADPGMIGSYGPHLARALAPCLELDEALLLGKLEPKMFKGAEGQMRTNRYVVLKRKVTREKWEEIRDVLEKVDLGEVKGNFSRKQRQMIRGVRRAIFADGVEDQLRVYPGRRMASHILGFVGGADHDGKEGIESVLDSKLTGTRGWRVTETNSKGHEVVSLRHQDVAARNGLNARLTIDSRVQHIVETELNKAMIKYRPQGVTAVVVRPSTGEIIAMANRPDFDPNRPGDFPAGHRRNRAVTDIAEPGSTFKAVTVAAALNERQVSLETVFDCERGSFSYGGRRLHDHHPYHRLSVKEIITKSSNIGSAKVALRLGSPKLYHYIRQFGFGERTRISLPGEVRGTVHRLNKWNKLSITRVPMGHEVAATPIQMVMMASAIANKGKLMRPMVLRQLEDERGQVVVKYHPEAVRQTVTPDTARKVTEALKTVVQSGGTATRAALEYYTVAGKTGTAQKAGRGGYIPGKYYSAFVGFFPADRPALCIYVALDEPAGEYYGGLTAAPVFKAIGERAASYLGIKPDLVPQGSIASRSGGR